LEILKISTETVFEISTDGRNIILSPQNDCSQERSILDSLAKINKKYGTVLAKLSE
jgi:hypothetical protein